MLSPGQQLRVMREQLGLTLRDVEEASGSLATRYGKSDFAIPLSRLSELENKGVVPTIYRVYTLSVIYRCDYQEILSLYGVDVNATADDTGLVGPARSHRIRSVQRTETVRMPIKLDPGFDLRRTSNLGRMVEQWGAVPMAYLSQFCTGNFTYGYIGVEDFTMYPLLLPGSFIQVDESKNRETPAMWRSEYERPVYFVETREGHTCCWCDLKGETLILQSHPLSPVAVRTLKYQREAEVLGQVVGVAMRLGDWGGGDSLPSRKGRQGLP